MATTSFFEHIFFIHSDILHVSRAPSEEIMKSNGRKNPHSTVLLKHLEWEKLGEFTFHMCLNC